MKTPHHLPPIAPDIAANFWPSLQPANRTAGSSPLAMGAAINLYELFEQNLALLVAGACAADQIARRIFSTLAPDQTALRRLVLGLANTARGCVPALPDALGHEGLVLPPARDIAIHVLLMPLNPARRGPQLVEPRGVSGARMVHAFTHVALHFETETNHAAEDARLLGSDGLHRALESWAALWSDCLYDLRPCAQSTRMQAYAGDLEPSRCWQTV